jgi:hypothetical protein
VEERQRKTLKTSGRFPQKRKGHGKCLVYLLPAAMPPDFLDGAGTFIFFGYGQAGIPMIKCHHSFSPEVLK